MKKLLIILFVVLFCAAPALAINFPFPWKAIPGDPNDSATLVDYVAAYVAAHATDPNLSGMTEGGLAVKRGGGLVDANSNDYQPPLTSSTDVTALIADANLAPHDMNVTGIAEFNQMTIGNMMVCANDVNLQLAYDWLKSSDRNATMGYLASKNRRTLGFAGVIKMPSSTPFVMDTNYVDLIGLGASRASSIIQSDLHYSAGPVVLQTASDVRMKNLTIYNWHTGVIQTTCLEIRGVDNIESEYIDVNYFLLSTSTVSSGIFYSLNGVERVSYFGGTWRNVNASAMSWYNGGSSNTKGYTCGTYENCTGGRESWSADANIILTGKWTNCTGGNYSFGGTPAGGGNVCTGYFQNCSAGIKSFSGNSIFAGIAINCSADTNSFGGYQNTGSPVRDSNGCGFTGYAIDCNAGKDSFGMGSSVYSIQTGTLINCRTDSDANYSIGINQVNSSLIATPNAKANAPYVPKNMTADANIYPFNSGGVYDINGKGVAVILTLPMASSSSWEFTFRDINNTAGSDANLKPYAGDHFILLDGTVMDAGEGYISDPSGDTYAVTKMRHYPNEPNVIRQELAIGTWVQETP